LSRRRKMKFLSCLYKRNEKFPHWNSVSANSKLKNFCLQLAIEKCGSPRQLAGAFAFFSCRQPFYQSPSLPILKARGSRKAASEGGPHPQKAKLQTPRRSPSKPIPLPAPRKPIPRLRRGLESLPGATRRRPAPISRTRRPSAGNAPLAAKAARWTSGSARRRGGFTPPSH